MATPSVQHYLARHKSIEHHKHELLIAETHIWIHSFLKYAVLRNDNLYEAFMTRLYSRDYKHSVDDLFTALKMPIKYCLAVYEAFFDLDRLLYIILH